MKLTATLFILLTYQICLSQTFIGLDQTQTTDLTILNDTIYASTYDGIYKIGRWNLNFNWIPCGMQGRHVVQTFVPDNLTFISLVEIDSTTTTQIYKSIDGGVSFNLMNPDTSMPNSYPFLDAMTHPQGNYDTLYFLNHHLKTYDGGLTWDTINSQSYTDRFIAINPSNHDLIIGGETMIFSPYIQTSSDLGNNWNFPSMNGYFAGDNCVHDLAFYNDTMYAAGEGVICRSIDGGNNWDQLYNSWNGSPNFSLYNWDIEVGNYGLYVTGSNTGAAKVPLIWAYNFGSFWDTLSITPFDSMNPMIRSMIVLPAPFGEDVFLGGHGVYVYNIIIGGVEEKQKHIVHVYPNPIHDILNIDIPSFTTNKMYNVSMLNSLGQCIQSFKIRDKLTRIDISNIPQGLYYIRVSDGETTIAGTKLIRN